MARILKFSRMDSPEDPPYAFLGPDKEKRKIIIHARWTLMNITISRESVYLIAVCLADTVVTIMLVSLGIAEEANPLMERFLRAGYWSFTLVKLATLLPAVVACEIYRRQNPEFVRKALRAGTAAYAGLYVALLLTVNL